jgi:phosphoribosylanthranilate isomerase
VQLAVELGATDLGFVLAPDSARCIDADRARELTQGIAAAQPVLVFRNAQRDDIVRACEAARVPGAQLHGWVTDDLVWLAARGVLARPVFAIDAQARRLPDLVPKPTLERPALLDTGSGGTGKTFPWGLLGGRAPAFTFLAGGITPENVGALLTHGPFGIDLSSGVESAPGIKDKKRLQRLFAMIGDQG